MHTAGIDIGSITAKAAIFEGGKLLATKVIFTGYNAELAGQKVYEEVLGEACLEKLSSKKLSPPDTAATALNLPINPIRKSCVTPPGLIF
jgi:hypothetical protein